MGGQAGQDDGGVAALGAGQAHVQLQTGGGQVGTVPEPEEAGEVGARREPELRVSRGRPLPARHRVGERAAEGRVGEGVVQHAHARVPAHPGDARRPGRGGDVLLLAPGDGERQEVALVLGPGGERHVDPRHQPAAADVLPDVLALDLDRPDRLVLGREPALLGEEVRQQVGEAGAQLLGKRLLSAALLLDREALPAVGHDQQRQLGRLALGAPVGLGVVLGHLEPVELVPRQRQEVGQVTDARELGAPAELDRHAALELGEVQLDRLGRAPEVGHAQDDVGLPVLVLVFAQVGEDLAVGGLEEAEGAAPERRVLLPDRDHPPHPVQQRGGGARLRLDVDRLVAVDRVHDGREVEPLRVGLGEARVPVGAPLHRRPDAVPVAEVDVVAHADLVAVVQHRCTEQGQQQAVHQLDLAGVVVEQRGEAAADADVDAHARVVGVDAVHVVPLARGDHLERQLVVVSEEDRPLAARGDVRRLPHDVDDGVTILLGDGHVHARHDREVIGHVALVALPEVLAHVLGPLVGLGEEHPVGVLRVERGADLLQDVVGLGQVLAAGALALDQVGDRVEAQPVHPEIAPERHHAEHRLEHGGVVEVQVRLVGEEAVPVVLLGERVPGPVGGLGVGEDDAGIGVVTLVVRPDVEVALRGALRGVPGALEPGVLIGGVVDDQLGDHAKAPRVRLVDELARVVHGAVVRVHRLVLGDVVAVVALRARVERQHPDGVHPELLDVVEPLGQAAEIPGAVAVAVAEGLDVRLVDDRVLVPERVALAPRLVRGGLGGAVGGVVAHRVRISCLARRIRARGPCRCVPARGADRARRSCAGRTSGTSRR